MNKFWIVVKEVYRKNVFSWSFFWMTVSPIIFFAVAMLIGHFIGQSTQENIRGVVGIVGADAAIVQSIESSSGGNEYLTYSDQEAAEAAFFDKEIDGFLVFEQPEDAENVTYYSSTESKNIDLSVIQSALQEYMTEQTLEQLGVSQTILSTIQQITSNIETVNLTKDVSGTVSEEKVDDSKQSARQSVAFFVCLIILIFISNYVGVIGQEIAAEKGSRIMEIILSSISSTQHFLGKICGVFAVILTQLLVYCVLFLGAKVFLGNWVEITFGFSSSNINTILDLIKVDLLKVVLFLVIGLIIYIALAGFAGSLVSKTEDVSKVQMPIIFSAMGGFYIGMFAFSQPNNIVVKVGSYIPIFTPFIIPFRIATDTISNMEMAIIAIVCLLFAVFCVAISMIFYKSNSLIVTDKGVIQTFKRSYELWKSER